MGLFLIGYMEVRNSISLLCRACRNGTGLAAPVLAGPVFLKVKIKFHFYKNRVISKSTSVIVGLVRLIILSYNR